MNGVATDAYDATAAVIGSMNVGAAQIVAMTSQAAFRGFFRGAIGEGEDRPFRRLLDVVTRRTVTSFTPCSRLIRVLRIGSKVGICGELCPYVGVASPARLTADEIRTPCADDRQNHRECGQKPAQWQYSVKKVHLLPAVSDD